VSIRKKFEKLLVKLEREWSRATHDDPDITMKFIILDCWMLYDVCSEADFKFKGALPCREEQRGVELGCRYKSSHVCGVLIGRAYNKWDMR
jgi:hypothetical protein